MRNRSTPTPFKHLCRTPPWKNACLTFLFPGRHHPDLRGKSRLNHVLCRPQTAGLPGQEWTGADQVRSQPRSPARFGDYGSQPSHSGENSFRGTRKALELTEGLKKEDTVLFLLSGGGSALFELSELDIGELQDINSQLISCGAGIHEINTVRNRHQCKRSVHCPNPVRPKGTHFPENSYKTKFQYVRIIFPYGKPPFTTAFSPASVPPF